ncbi:MAG: hypothetical protein MPK62_12350, partial [Alphaproteobacteria bacterium]|nr:hypothetical protein [Alphaproteobacteria bacterium]
MGTKGNYVKNDDQVMWQHCTWIYINIGRIAHVNTSVCRLERLGAINFVNCISWSGDSWSQDNDYSDCSSIGNICSLAITLDEKDTDASALLDYT